MSVHGQQQDDDRHGHVSNDVLFQVLDARLGKATIYTTNLPGADLRARIGPRNFSRIIDDAKIVKMYGDDYRLAQLNF